MKINQKEYELLKGLDEEWKWIARDNPEDLFIYKERPKRFEGTQTWDDLKDNCAYLKNDLLQFIQWEDSEPYNTSELIEEYENWLKGYEVDWDKVFGRESEETEVKKDKKWLVDKWTKERNETDVHDPMYQFASEFIADVNQLEEPEVKQLYEKIRELESYNDELIRDNNQFRNELDNQEVLSRELPTIPQFVSGWIEETKKQGKSYIYAIASIYDKYETDEPLSEEENRIFQWVEAYDNDEVFARAWLDGYKIKKEPKYNVEFKVKSEFGTVGLFLYKKCDEIFVGDDFEDYCPKEDKYRLTEYEIKKYDERLWPFRKPVEEVE